MARSDLSLSVLDIGPIRTNQTASQCFASMVALAGAAEDYGYGRYWLAEHHNVAAVAASHTPVFASTVGARTSRIRIGGCVLLPHYTPFLVAEQMALLEACFPGRVDLGLGRSAGSDGLTTALLRGDRRQADPQSYERLVLDLRAMIQPTGVTLDLKDREYTLRAAPSATSAPAVWMLGTSSQSARMAAELGLPYAFGYHIRGEGVDEAIGLYRTLFKPSAYCPEPRVLLSAIVVIGETAEEAERLARPQLYFMSAFRSGETVSPQMLVEEGDIAVFPDRYRDLVSMFRRTWIIGSPKAACEQIELLADRLNLSEVMINPVGAAYQSDDPARAPNRERTLAALAKHFTPNPR